MKAKMRNENNRRNGEVVRRAKEGNPPKGGQAPEDKELLQIVWQTAYPFAGSNVALNLLQKFTGYSMATNYGDILDSKRGWVETVFDDEPIREDMINGPFKYRVDMDLPPSGNILVKTHCVGHCMFISNDECSLKDIVVPLNEVREFFEGCAHGTIYQHKHTEDAKYDPWKTKKVLILIRHPIDIIVSRFINILEGLPSDTSDPYTMDNIGIGEWCTDFNNIGTSKSLLSWYPDEAAEMVTKMGVPCHEELYSIAKFYSQCLKVINVLDDEHHIVKFEDYDRDLDGTIQGIMNFLEYRSLENQKEIPFNRTGDNSMQYFSPHEVKKMLRFFSIHATDQANKLFEDYV